MDVFRRTEDLPSVAEEAIAAGAPVFWAQLGLWSPEAAKRCVAAGLDVVMDRCLKIEHARFHGGLHLADSTPASFLRAVSSRRLATAQTRSTIPPRCAAAKTLGEAGPTRITRQQPHAN